MVAIITALILLVSLSACTKNEEVINPIDEPSIDVVATVNGVEIKWDQFKTMVDDMKLYYQQFNLDFDSDDNKELLSMLEGEALNILIQEELVYRYALENNYEVSDEEIDKEIELFKSQFDSEEEFLEVLGSNGLTLDTFRVKITRDKVLSDYTKNEMRDVDVTEEELLSLYEEYKNRLEELPPLEEIRARLEDEINQQKFLERFEELINYLKSKSEIEIFI